MVSKLIMAISAGTEVRVSETRFGRGDGLEIAARMKIAMM